MIYTFGVRKMRDTLCCHNVNSHNVNLQYRKSAVKTRYNTKEIRRNAEEKREQWREFDSFTRG